MRSPSLEKSQLALESRVARDSALSFLLKQAERGFPDATHEMQFPRRAGFVLARRETHRSDLFARATIANVLSDCAELYADLGEEALARDCRAVARSEALYLAHARLHDCAGGWSYFPTLPELPPDLDSLAAMTSLFARVGEGLPELVRSPIELALTGRGVDGGLETWLVAATDAKKRRRSMLSAIERFWGKGPDPEVNAAFHRALIRLDPVRYAAAIADGVRYVSRVQTSDGSWPATWYFGAGWGSLAALDLLEGAANTTSSVEVPSAIQRCRAHFARTQNDEGGWGEWQTVPLETALALHVLSADTPRHEPSLERGLRCLLGFRTHAGHFNGSPWIRMDVGRARGSVTHRLTFMSHSVSTAVCLRTLLVLEANERWATA